MFDNHPVEDWQMRACETIGSRTRLSMDDPEEM